MCAVHLFARHKGGPGPLGNPEPDPEVVVGDPYEAWRLWNCEYRMGVAVLRSIYYRAHWPARRRMVARCFTGGTTSLRLRELTEMKKHDCPNRVGYPDCGIYAVKDRNRCQSWYVTGKALEGVPVVVGTVALWGRIIRCEHGYRAQYAYPKELIVEQAGEGMDAHVLAADLERAYGVPARVELRSFGPRRAA